MKRKASNRILFRCTLWGGVLILALLIGTASTYLAKAAPPHQPQPDSALAIPDQERMGAERESGSLSPKTIWVDDDFIDDPPNHKWNAIQEGVNDASSGDTVYVYSGTYFENVVVDKSLTLQGEDRDTTIIASGTGQHGTVSIGTIGVDYVEISGFTIRYGRLGIDISPGGKNRRIIGNRILDAHTGICLDDRSSNNTIKGNVISRCEYGIRAWFQANDNKMSDNTIIYNTAVGIQLTACTHDNIIYHNNFIENRIQAEDPCADTNHWYDPVSLEGNYWSDYTGLDDGSGTSPKHDFAYDGIGDTEIPHPGEGYDFYPFIQKDGWKGPGAVAEMTADKHRYKIGENVNFTLTNVGDYTLCSHGVAMSFRIEDEIGEEVWATDLGYVPLVPEPALEPGESMSWTWDQTYLIYSHESHEPIPPTGDQVPPGRYVAKFGYYWPYQRAEAKLVISGILSRIEVIPSDVALQLNETQQFDAKGYDDQGSEVSITPIWSTTGGAITQDGLYTAIMKGDWTVTASVDWSPVIGIATLHIIRPVEIMPPQLARIDVIPSDVTLRLNDTQGFYAKGYDAAGNEIQIEPGWSTDGGNIVALSIDGRSIRYKGTKLGDFTVTATDTESQVQGKAYIHVRPLLSRIEVTPPDVTLRLNDTQGFYAKGYDAEGNEVPIMPIWSTDGGNIDDTGHYSATELGDFTVTATDTESQVQGKAHIHVEAAGIAWWLWGIGALAVIVIVRVAMFIWRYLSARAGLFTSVAIEKFIEGFMKNEPVSTDIYDAFPRATVEDCPPHPVSQEMMDDLARNGEVILGPGVYDFFLQSFCLHAGKYAPTSGSGYLVAPLEGRQSTVIYQILRNSPKHPIPQRRIQTLIWAIQSGTKYEEMPSELQSIADRLLTEEELEPLHESFWDKLPKFWDKLPKSIRNRVLSKVPEGVLQTLDAVKAVRERILDASTSYEELERTAVKFGEPFIPEDMLKIKSGEWCLTPKGYSVRVFPISYERIRVQVYIPAGFVDDPPNNLESRVLDGINLVEAALETAKVIRDEERYDKVDDFVRDITTVEHWQDGFTASLGFGIGALPQKTTWLLQHVQKLIKAAHYIGHELENLLPEEADRLQKAVNTLEQKHEELRKSIVRFAPAEFVAVPANTNKQRLGIRGLGF